MVLSWRRVVVVTATVFPLFSGGGCCAGGYWCLSLLFVWDWVLIVDH
jgi:hypothetical protein